MVFLKILLALLVAHLNSSFAAGLATSVSKSATVVCTFLSFFLFASYDLGQHGLLRNVSAKLSSLSSSTMCFTLSLY